MWQLLGFVVVLVGSYFVFRPQKKDEVKKQWEEDIKHKRKNKQNLSWSERYEAQCEEHGWQWIFLVAGGAAVFLCSFRDWTTIIENWPLLRGIEKIGEALFIAAFVSLIFDLGYHKSVFGDHVEHIEEKISTSSRELDTLKLGLENATEAVEQLTNLLGYGEFRKSTLRKFGDCGTRIVSASNYWPIDPNWWFEPDKWTQTDLYIQLWKSLEKSPLLTLPGQIQDDEFLQITFAGNAPWPIAKLGDRPTLNFSHYEFRRFLGVMWRAVIAHRLRRDIREKVRGAMEALYPEENYEQLCEHFSLLPPVGSAEKEKWHDRIWVPLYVAVAPMPVAATIVDNDVWVLFPGSERSDFFQARGYHLTRKIDEDASENEAHRQLADTYIELLNRYLRHSRSAREYVESVFVLTMHFDNVVDENNYLERGPFENDNLNKCLLRLGLKEWAKEEVRLANEKNSQSLNVFEEEQLESAAQAIVYAFRETLWGAGEFGDSYARGEWIDKNTRTFGHLMEDLF